MRVRTIQVTALAFFALLFAAKIPARAQAPASATGTIRGDVSDPSGATVAGATVLLTGPDGKSHDFATNKDGVYEAAGLAPGSYAVKVVAEGFGLFTAANVMVKAGQVQTLKVALTLEEQKIEIHVEDSPTQLDVDPSNNAGAIILKDKDLEALSDDPDELMSELQALAGPSAGPNGGQIYIDGFTGGQLPPKASIREIRVNQNPFSAEFDKLGYGRIEVFTKPGTDKYHGQLYLSGNTAGFNSRNPFEVIPDGTTPPGYETTEFSGSIGGPLTKKASFFFNFERRNINDLSIVSATILDPNFNIINFSDAVANPRVRTNLSPRFDYQISKNNTLTARYQYERNRQDNQGIGLFDLASTGYNSLETEQSLQVSDTQILTPKIINETRFQFIRETTNQNPLNTAPTVSVQQAFTDGGSSQGTVQDILDRYEFQNYTSMALGKHFLKFGVRLRANRDTSVETSDFNGSFSFGSRQDPSCTGGGGAGTCPIISGLQAYQITQQGLANGLTFAQISAMGGGASQYSITTGSASADITYFDAGLYVQDDFHLRPNMTLSYGLRFESQNNLGDHADFAPRIGFAWGLGAKAKNAAPKIVLRAGFGIFYDRFTYELALQQQRLNGITQQQFLVTNPQFFLSDTPDPSSLPAGATAPTIYQANTNLRTPYILQTGISVERQLTKNANLSVTYLGSRGLHQFFTENINPPECPSLPCDASTAPRPLGGSNNIYQYQSEGLFKQNQLIVNSSIRMGTKLSLFGYYTLNFANSDAGAGASSFPSSQNNISLDYGRSAFDVRHRVFFGGTIGLPYSFRLSPFMIASSGSPYNITTGQDLNGDSIFNDRPAFASPNSIPSNVVTNRSGSFDVVPQPGEKLVPINELTGPGRFSLNVRLSKSFGFGKKAEATATAVGGPGAGGTFGRGPGRGGGGRGGGGGGGRGGGFDAGSTNHRYNLTFSVSARNIFNNVNLALPIGNLSSPLFGQSNGLASGFGSSATANRRIDLQMSFNF
ncbi:MAG: carboxypeptidase regulatory-like domain-containing protein [Candidatus Acidiferrum sp.]